MIYLLRQAFLALLSRGETGVVDLQKTIQKYKSDGADQIPEKVVERFSRVEEMAVGTVDEIRNKLSTLGILEQNISSGAVTNERAEKMLVSLLKAYRDLRRRSETIEENFIGHLIRYDEVDLFLTKVAHCLWNEARLPDLPPIVVANTFGYFCTQPYVGIIFSPPSAGQGLLIYPDLCHEFGHIVNQIIGLFGKRFRSELDRHIESLSDEQRRRSRPLPDWLIDSVRNTWMEGWAEEVACDVFATYILGPAYAWCNLHVCLNNSNAYEWYDRHPADCARTQNIITALRRVGFDKDADTIQSIWDRYLGFSGASKPSYYNEYHPQRLFSGIIEDVESAIGDNGLGPALERPLIDLLNESWKSFNSDPDGFQSWQVGELVKLKTRLN